MQRNIMLRNIVQRNIQQRNTMQRNIVQREGKGKEGSAQEAVLPLRLSIGGPSFSSAHYNTLEAHFSSRAQQAGEHSSLCNICTHPGFALNSTASHKIKAYKQSNNQKIEAVIIFCNAMLYS